MSATVLRFQMQVSVAILFSNIGLCILIVANLLANTTAFDPEPWSEFLLPRHLSFDTQMEEVVPDDLDGEPWQPSFDTQMEEVVPDDLDPTLPDHAAREELADIELLEQAGREILLSFGASGEGDAPPCEDMLPDEAARAELAAIASDEAARAEMAKPPPLLQEKEEPLEAQEEQTLEKEKEQEEQTSEEDKFFDSDNEGHMVAHSGIEFIRNINTYLDQMDALQDHVQNQQEPKRRRLMYKQPFTTDSEEAEGDSQGDNSQSDDDATDDETDDIGVIKIDGADDGMLPTLDVPATEPPTTQPRDAICRIRTRTTPRHFRALVRAEVPIILWQILFFVRTNLPSVAKPDLDFKEYYMGMGRLRDEFAKANMQLWATRSQTTTSTKMP